MLSHPAQTGRLDHSGGRSGVTSGLVCLSLRSLPRGPILRLSRVAPISWTAHPARGALPRPGRRRPTTLAGVMRWHAGAAIIMAGGSSVCRRPLLLHRGARASGAVPFQRVLLPKPSPQDKESWRPGACTGPVLAGTPARGARRSWSARPGSSGMVLTRGAGLGGRHASREVGLPDSLA